MKKLLILIGMTLALSSCIETKPMLYNWGYKNSSKNASEYETLLYDNYHSQTPESVCALLCQYEYMVTHPGGQRGVIPPGICAEYGYLLLSSGTAETFLNHATKKQKDIRHYERLRHVFQRERNRNAAKGDGVVS